MEGVSAVVARVLRVRAELAHRLVAGRFHRPVLEELAERCDEDDDRRKLLSSLASRCMSEDAASRPRTVEVRGELEKLLT